MARTVQDAKLATREARRKLAIRGKPYFRLLDNGLHLGYRKGKTGGVWLLRQYVGNEAYKFVPIGPTDDNVDADGKVFFDFAQAQKKARELFARRKREEAGLPTEAGPYTVRACLDEYLKWMEGARKSAPDARYRAEALILPVLGGKACADLTAADIEKWRDATAKAPARLRTRRGEKQKFSEQGRDDEAIRRRRASTNRTLTILKAALNRAWRASKIAADDAWRRVEPFEEADAARIRYLTIDEAKRLINAADSDFRLLVRAALATGCRYGELCALKVSDFNPDTGTLHIRTSKSGKGRHVVLAKEGAALFASTAAGRPGDEPMLTKANGSPWLASHQARPMRETCARARIGPPANFHCLRHTYASHTIMNAAPKMKEGGKGQEISAVGPILLVVAKNLGHADTRMVEKHYGHMAPSFIADAIRAAAPRFDVVEPGPIAPFGRAKGSSDG